MNGVAGSSSGGGGILISKYLFCLARFPPTLLDSRTNAPLSSLSLSGSVMQPPMDELKLCYVMRQKRGGQLGSVMPPINASCCSVNCNHPFLPIFFLCCRFIVQSNFFKFAMISIGRRSAKHKSFFLGSNGMLGGRNHWCILNVIEKQIEM